MRLEAEESLEMVKQELNRQTKLYQAHLKLEREQNVKLQDALQEQMNIANEFEEQLQDQANKIKMLEQLLAQHEEEKARQSREQQVKEDYSQEPAPRSIEKKRVWTII